MAAHSRSTFVPSRLTASAACSRPDAAPPPPPEVEVLVAQPTRLPVVQSLVGRISAIRSAEVRARVAGVIQKRAYTEGTDVREGDLLFLIDPAPYRAALRQRTLRWRRRARRKSTQRRVRSAIAISRAAASSRGRISTMRPRRPIPERPRWKRRQPPSRAARLDLAYTTVRAPIAGSASKALVTEGALVGEDEATHLTTVEQIDQVYVDFNQSMSEVEAMRRQQASGAIELAAPKTQRVRVLYEDGTEYRRTAAR